MTASSWKDFFETSTIHGLGEIVRSKTRTEKTFFIVSLVACNFFSFYGIGQIVLQYMARPVATSYFVNEAAKLKLPDVTICPFNRLDKQYLDEQRISEDLAKYIEWAFFFVNPKYDFVDFKIGKMAQLKTGNLPSRLDNTLSRLNVTFEELVNRASLPCEDLVKSCEQQYTPFNCCAHAKPILTSMGQCYRMAGKDQIGSGFGMGMSIVIRLPLDRFMPSENMLMNDGVMIKLTEPNKGYEFDAIFIPTGVHALMQLRATQLDFMHDPPRYSCRHEVPSEHYAPLLCYQRCILSRAHEACACRYIGLPPDIDDEASRYLPACKPNQLIFCIYPTLAKSYDKDHNYALKCKEMCESRCNYWQYHATVSYAKYPSETLTKSYFKGSEHQKMTQIQSLKAREIILELFYDKLEYTLIKHFPSMSPDQFIANIGGQMGLWMGGSTLSIIHLIVFLCLCSGQKTKQGAHFIRHQSVRRTDGELHGDARPKPSRDIRNGSIRSISLSCEDLKNNNNNNNINESENKCNNSACAKSTGSVANISIWRRNLSRHNKGFSTMAKTSSVISNDIINNDNKVNSSNMRRNNTLHEMTKCAVEQEKSDGFGALLEKLIRNKPAADRRYSNGSSADVPEAERPLRS